MRFTLVYADSLRANGDVGHKHGIRRVLHKQLVELWKGAPNALQRPGDHLCRRVGTWRFFPLACPVSQ